ncbi:MAG: mechanosensitive ion channel [Saprospiraceae bacterium]|nr:mechanosensitive ion channel [Saprospiraceae bacterium]
MNTINNILEFQIINVAGYSIRVYSLLIILLIYLITVATLWLLKRSLFRRQEKSKLDSGNTYALFQIIKYVIWVIAIGLILETLGINITVLIAGSAALLVGVGLGLQQTFNDVISGVILLSERTVKVNDVLDIDGDVVQIQQIGLRTSKGLNTDDISIIIPNSLITTSKVINWSHQSKKTRFRIDVGVSYGSDVDLVMKILEECAYEHPDVYDRELIEARLVGFGNSSLDFQVLFFSNNIFRISKVKSDIRKIITSRFNSHNVTIPFPQLDLHIKSKDNNLSKE